jgi:hypothetical protein
MTRNASLLLMLVMCGCGGLSLDEMKAPGLFMQTLNPFDEPVMKPYVTLREIQEREEGEAIEKGDCPDLSGGTRAFVDDVEVPMEGPGGWHSGGFLGPAPYCSPTTFRTESSLPLPGAEDVTRIRITEGDKTFIAETQGLCGPRSFRMSAPADGVLRSGVDVELEWLPATDILLVHRVIVGTQAGEVDLSLRSGTLQIEGNRMRFRMPFLATQATGEASISLAAEGSYDLFHAGPTRCEGFAECRFQCWIRNQPSSIKVRAQGG